MSTQEKVGRSVGKPPPSNQQQDKRADSPVPTAAPRKPCSTKDSKSQTQASETPRDAPSRKPTHDNNPGTTDHQRPSHLPAHPAPAVPEKPTQHPQDPNGKVANPKPPNTLRKKAHPGESTAQARVAASKGDSQSPASSEIDATDHDEPGTTPPNAERFAHHDSLDDTPQGRSLLKPDTTQPTKPGSRHTTVTNTSSSRPLSPEDPNAARHSAGPTPRLLADALKHLPSQPPPGITSASSYAAATAGIVSNTTATHGPNTAHATIYEQQMHGRILPDQNSEDRSGQGDSGGEQMQVDLGEYVGVDREGSRGNGEASGFTGGGFIGGVANVLGIGLSRAGPAPAPPNGKLEKEYLKAMKENSNLQDELRRTQRKLENYVAELQRATTEGRTYYRAARDLQHDNQRLQDNVQSLEHELSNVLKQYQDAKSLSDTRGKELVGAQVFLNKADSLSISDLINKVGTLNEEIFQAAASLGEVLHYHKHQITEEDMQKRFNFACGLVGEPLVQIVVGEAQKPEPAAHPLLVQITIQVFITSFCAKKIQTWAAGKQDLDRQLRSLYSGIRASTDQAVSGRWRALTRAQLRSSSEKWEQELEYEIEALVTVASWQTAPEQRVAFVSKLPAIFKAVEDVKISLTEKFTSADIEITSVPPSTPFNKSIMEEAYSDEGAPNTGPIVATTGLGLSKVVHNPNNPSEMHYENVLSPTVVLDTSLKAALEPAEPRKKTKKRIVN